MVVQLTAAQQRVAGMARLNPTPVADALVLVGAVLLGIAAASLAVHWLGALIVGAIQLLLGGLAVLIPTPGFLSGAYSPTWEITGMLRDLDSDLGVGSTVFFFSGTAAVLGAFLIAAALGVRTRWDSPRTKPSIATVASIIGGVVLLAAFGLLLTVGDDFARHLLTALQYEFPLAIGIVAAAVLAGIGGLTLRYSSVGCVLAGALALVAGLVTFVARTALPSAVTRSFVIEDGLLLVLGASVLGAAFAASLRRPAA
jgi:hypothetical protein